MISAATWLMKGTVSVRSLSDTFSRKKDLVGCLAGPTTNAPPGPRPTIADVADVRQLDLSPASFRTKFGGLFLFLPMLASIPLDRILHDSGFPAREMIPAGCAMRSLLALKLFGTGRHSHVMSEVLDQGLALFAGLNVIPKRSFLTEYSCRVDPACYPELMRRWFDAVSRLGLPRGNSFNLDFHTIPFHGEDALIEKHYVSKRSRRQKGILAFLVQDADTRVFCYANGELRKQDQNDEILRFARFWKERTGRYPQELIFDSKLTTYAKLNELNQLGIRFITLRRRSKGLDAGDRPDARFCLATHRAERCFAAVRPSPHRRSIDRFGRLRWRLAPGDGRRLGSRGANALADQPTDGDASQVD